MLFFGKVFLKKLNWRKEMKALLEKYFGNRNGGVNLLKTLNALDLGQLNALKGKIKTCLGRVFFLGNGGSYDNARWMAQVLRQNGIMAKTPGEEEDYILTIKSKNYSDVFVEALKLDGLSEKDLVIGISGSGNSQNVLIALEYAQIMRAPVFALGGRDGGAVLKMLGEGSCIIVKNQCMEAIEDIHNFSLAIIIESLKSDETLSVVKERFIRNLGSFFLPINFEILSMMTAQMLRTINCTGRVFILGFGIGANHFRADMGRGATNALPIRGLHCPEVFTMNSLQATANDDGTDFLLVDGLVKFNPDKDDFAIICQRGHKALELCEDHLKNSQVPLVEIGGSGITIDCFSEQCFDMIVAMIGHACGQVIRTYLGRQFKVKPLMGEVELRGNQKKMSMLETLDLERELKRNGTIKKSDAITFCYGKAFAVSSKEEYQREFY